MTQEEKQLLLNDLCSRLPYGVKLGFENSDLILVPEEFNVYTKQLSTNQIYPKVDRAVIKHIYDVWNYRPYLRPLSSMSEEERQSEPCVTSLDGYMDYYEAADYVDWLNAHHFDYRGLISMGLALEAPENMYKNE